MSGEALKSNIGSSFFEKIEKALENSQHFILLSSVNSMNSEWVKTEYETFYNEYFIPSKGERRLLIAKGESYNQEFVPTLLRRLQIADSPKDIIDTFLMDRISKPEEIIDDIDSEIEIVKEIPYRTDTNKLEKVKEKVTKQKEESNLKVERQNSIPDKRKTLNNKQGKFLKSKSIKLILFGFSLISILVLGINYKSTFNSEPTLNTQNTKTNDTSNNEATQKNPEKLMTPSGYHYTHVRTHGQKVQEGDFVYITVTMKGSDGKVLQDMGEGTNMPILQMPTAEKPLTMPNPLIDMLLKGGLGDSLTLIMPIDSFPNKSNPQLAGMEFVEYVTCIKRIEDETGYKADKEETRLKQEKEIGAVKARLGEVGVKTEQILKDYKAGKLDVQTTPEGLKYVIHEQGDGAFGRATKKATVHYYGAFMDGKMFDSSFKRGSPYTFNVGKGQVIQGWDLGIQFLKKGAKASFFIPYNLAYGADGNPPTIPKKSDMMFYMELVDVN